MVYIKENIQVFAPNSFSPNNDIFNQKFSISVYGDLTTYDLKIFDRWGVQMLHSDNPETEWDGTYKGANCPEDTYIYILKYQLVDVSIKTIYGHINLIR